MTDFFQQDFPLDFDMFEKKKSYPNVEQVLKKVNYNNKIDLRHSDNEITAY